MRRSKIVNRPPTNRLLLRLRQWWQQLITRWTSATVRKLEAEAATDRNYIAAVEKSVLLEQDLLGVPRMPNDEGNSAAEISQRFAWLRIEFKRLRDQTTKPVCEHDVYLFTHCEQCYTANNNQWNCRQLPKPKVVVHE